MGTQIHERITQGLRYLAEEVSADRDEFRRDNQPGGSALLAGIESLGYAHRGKTTDTLSRVALTPAGQRRLADAEPSDGDDQ